MSRNDAPDPFPELQDWAHKTEQKVRRQRLRRAVAGRVPAVVVGVAALVALAFTIPAGWAMMRDTTPTAGPPRHQADGVSTTVPENGSPDDPFAGTPAASYPKGAAGISLPAAKPVPGFTAKQVDAALKQVRQAMIAGRLDSEMLIAHKPDKLLALLAPSHRAGIRKWFTGLTHANVATWIDPAVRLDPREEPRVSGKVTYTSTIRDGRRELRITTNFVWVYAFEGTDQPIVVTHDEIQWEFPSTKGLRADDHGMWIGDTKSYAAFVDCAATDRGLLAPTRIGGAPEPADTDDPDDLLRADHPLEIQDDCP
jgi:hypothetical protein